MRRGQTVVAVLLLCLLVAGAVAWSAISLANQSVRGSAWAKGESAREMSARSALEWARYRLASDHSFLTLEAPSAGEAVPGASGLLAVSVQFNLASGARQAVVSGPDMPVPPGLAAGLYCWVEDNFSADGLSEAAPVPLGGLAPSWEVAPDPTTPGSGAVESPGLFRAGNAGVTSVFVPVLSAAGNSVPVGSCQAARVEVGDLVSDPPVVRLSPRVETVDNVRDVPFTAVVYGPSGARQAVPPEAMFELAGLGSLVEEPWGVLYRPAGPGKATVRVTVVEGEVTCSDEVSFDVVKPQRLCRVVPVVEGRPRGEAWLRDYGGRVSVLTWDAGGP